MQTLAVKGSFTLTVIQTQHQTHRCRFACSIWTQKTSHLTRFYFKREIIDGKLFAVFFAQMTYLNHKNDCREFRSSSLADRVCYSGYMVIKGHLSKEQKAVLLDKATEAPFS